MNKLLIILFTIYLVGCDTAGSMSEIHQQVADDSVSQYYLSLKGGDNIEICVHAGLVVAAFNQANDEVNYLKWKKIETRECETAGLR